MNTLSSHAQALDLQLVEAPLASGPLLTVIVPFYNETAVLAQCHRRLLEVLQQEVARSAEHFEILYIDDGSSDESWQLLVAEMGVVHGVDIRAIKLSRNFGKEAAMCAGLDLARGQCAILLDADLQDPPELIPKMLQQWRQGYDVVDMRRTSRQGESWFKRFSAAAYYKLINRLSDIEIPENVGDFRLLDRKVLEALKRLPERSRYMKGLFAWPGFKRKTLDFDRCERLAGETKWHYAKLLHLAFEGITSFSTKPLRMATFAGLACALCAALTAAFVVLKTAIFGDPVAGFPTVVSLILMLGGVQLLAIGLIGEYLGRLFIEAKQRPVYLVMEELELSAQEEKNS
ncbi:MAG: glycosyltransferase family 2 protein [Pseudomonadales bacterium]